MGKIEKFIIAAADFVAKTFLAIFGTGFAICTLAAFCSIFHDDAFMGLLGTAAAGALTWITWETFKSLGHDDNR